MASFVKRKSLVALTLNPNILTARSGSQFERTRIK